jgi:hypothetical protein
MGHGRLHAALAIVFFLARPKQHVVSGSALAAPSSLEQQKRHWPLATSTSGRNNLASNVNAAWV